MLLEQLTIAGILLAAMVLFVLGRPRYDVVALIALLAAVLTGLVPTGEAFAGFGHPAVITVAMVLVLSQGLRNAGIVDMLAGWVAPLAHRPAVLIATLSTLVGFSSAFMNNVGALAVMMPVALQAAEREKHPPAAILMPLSFGAILGGLSTLIGTPPNVIIAAYRTTVADAPFAMFDFAPVGATVAVAGILFLALIGWRLVPRERLGQTARDKLFRIEDYMCEVRVSGDSELIGKTIGELEGSLAEHEVSVGALIRGKTRRVAPSRFRTIEGGDLLILRGDAVALGEALASAGLELVGDVDLAPEHLTSENVTLSEAVVTRGSQLDGRSALSVGLRRRFGLNLLAVSRQESTLRGRLQQQPFRPGDVLLLQGDAATLTDTLQSLGLLPLMQRKIDLSPERNVLLAIAVFGGALAAAALGLVPAAVALAVAVVAYVLLGLIAVRDLYEGIDWPVIVLLGAMIPVGGALESTGAAAAVGGLVASLGGDVPAWAILTFVLVLTMTLSDLMNNAATAVVMAPIAVNIAQLTGGSTDAFLMAVAVGASCAFLTPIGHQCNTLVLGPGGYRFGDYWRVGLPLEVLIVAVAVPLIMAVWA